MTTSAGYSGKPLWQKLGLKPGQRIAVIDAPSDYATLTGFDLAQITPADAELDIAHLFVATRPALSDALPPWLPRMRAGGAIWVSWPKKSSPLYRDLRAGSPNGTAAGSDERLTEDGVRDIVLPLGWVDVKVCAVDADWSGLKLLRQRVA